MTNELSKKTLKIEMDEEPIDIFLFRMSQCCDFSYEALKVFDDAVKEEYSKSSVSLLKGLVSCPN